MSQAPATHSKPQTDSKQQTDSKLQTDSKQQVDLKLQTDSTQQTDLKLQPNSSSAKSSDVGINISSQPTTTSNKDETCPVEFEPPSCKKIVVYLSILGFLMSFTMGLSGLSVYYIWETRESNKRWSEILDRKSTFPKIDNDIIFGGKTIQQIAEINNALKLKPKVKRYLDRGDYTHDIVFYFLSVFLGILFLHFILFLIIKKVRLHLQVTSIMYSLDAMVLFCAGVFLLLALSRVNLKYLRARIYFERTRDAEGHDVNCVRTSTDNQTVAKYDLDVQESNEAAQKDINEHDHEHDVTSSSSGSSGSSDHPRQAEVYCCHVLHLDSVYSSKTLFAIIKTCAYVSTKKNPRDPCRNATKIPVTFENSNRTYNEGDLTALLICPDQLHLRITLYLIGGALVSAVLVLWFASYSRHVLREPASWNKTLPWPENGSKDSRDWKSRRRIPSFMLTEFNTETAAPTTAKLTATIDNLIDTPHLHSSHHAPRRQTKNLMELFPDVIVHPPAASRTGSQEALHTSGSVVFTRSLLTKSIGKIETIASKNAWFSESD